MEEKKRTPVHNFRCNDCQIKFSFESEISDVNVFAKSFPNGIKCPKCEKVWGSGANITHEFVAPLLVQSLKARGNENLERSKMAHEMAARYREEHGDTRMTEVKRSSTMGAPTMFGGAVERVPESVVKSLEDKAIPNEGE